MRSRTAAFNTRSSASQSDPGVIQSHSTDLEDGIGREDERPQSTSKPNRYALPGNRKGSTRRNLLEFRTARRRKKSHGTQSKARSKQTDFSQASFCSSILPLILAVLLWYSLGVVSISSSKVLLTPYSAAQDGTDDDEYGNEYDDDEFSLEQSASDGHRHKHRLYHHVGGLPPLFLTLQQLLLGSMFLRSAIQMQLLGLTKGIVPLDVLIQSFVSTGNSNGDTERKSSDKKIGKPGTKLVWTGIYFALGFLTTNLAFGAAAPTYVETLKAAEPISSAIFAFLWGIERLTCWEILGLGGIVGGVLLSTNGSNHAASMSGDAASSLATATAIVIASNFCFSLRGLYQKLFRNGLVESNRGGSNSNDGDQQLSIAGSMKLDDLNLQFRMQQTGVLLLLLPTILLDGKALVEHVIGAASNMNTTEFRNLLQRYLLWSIGNGLAFSSYNLASTYLLSRISVVHHAALNCTRRIFAIVCTGVLFGIPISFQSMIGIGISFGSFMVFTWAKARKNPLRNKERHVSSIKRDIPNGDGVIHNPPPSIPTASNSQNDISKNESGSGPDDQFTHRSIRSRHTSSKYPAVARAPPPPPLKPGPGFDRTTPLPMPTTGTQTSSKATTFRYPRPPPPPLPRR